MNDEAFMRKANTLLESQDLANKRKRLDQLEARIVESNIQPQEWATLRQSISTDPSFSDEQRDAMETTINGIQRLGQLNDKNGVLERSARNLTQLVVGAKCLKMMKPENIGKRVADIAEAYFEATALYANDEQQREAAEASGSIMTSEEIAAAKERMLNIKIS